MSDPGTILGVDRRDDRFITALVDVSGERPRVLGLQDLDPDPSDQSTLPAADRVVVSLADREAIVSNLHIPPGHLSDPIESARFEMAHSLGDDPAAFLIDILPTGNDRRFLGLAVRHRRLTETAIEPLKARFSIDTDPVGTIRSIALAHGYLSFCHPIAGELVAVVDAGRHDVSIAVVLKRNVISVSHLEHHFDLDSENQCRSLFLEIRTLIDFCMTRVFEDFATLPLAGVVIGGDIAEGMLSLMAGSFTAPVSRARVNTGYFDVSDDVPLDRLDRYLVALGLTVV